MKEAAGASASIFDIAKNNKKAATPMATAAAMLAVRSPTVPATNVGTANLAAAVVSNLPVQQVNLEG
jgi:hypothetical protein